ncbi:MAG: MBG domain-containing protein, partial [Tannerella sp.]|nr:MBG domain-containing protein [Tannerella sp.]
MKNIFELCLFGQGSRHNEGGGAAKRRVPSKTTTTVVTFLTVLLLTLFGGKAYAQPALTLDKSGTQSFSLDYGYDPALSVLPVEVENTGNAATGALTIALSGTNAGDFDLSPTLITDLAANDKTTFTVFPKGGLTVNGGTKYEVTVTVSDASSTISATFDIELTVNKATLMLTSDDFDVSGPTTVTYDGAAHTPIITAKDASLNVSIAYCDWNNGQTWSSSPPINAGTYIVVAYASNQNYQSDAVWGFENLVINKATLMLTPDDFDVSGQTSVTYDGVAHTPIITAKDAG